MEKYFFMKKILQLIAQGKFFRKAFAVALQILAVLVAIAALVIWIPAWKSISGASSDTILGIILFQLFFIIAVYMVVHALLIRSGDVADLPEADFTVIPIVSISLKLIGEIYASFVTVLSFAGGILIWFIKDDAFSVIKRSAPLVPSFGESVGFFGGLVFIAGGLFIAFFVLVAFYFLAEVVIVMVDIAKNTKVTRQIAEQYNKDKDNQYMQYRDGMTLTPP